VGEREYTRRRVVVDLGKGGLAIAILGLPGCSGRSGQDGGGEPGPATGPSVTGTTAGQTGSPSPAGSAATGPPDWKRVNLGFVSAYVLVRGSQAAVVDTGVAGSAQAIGQVLDAAGPGWAGVRHVILTHHHPDHAGSAGEVLGRATAATGHVGEADLGQVDSPRPLQPAADGAEVFGLQLVATPGHTAGHLSVFDPESGVLVVGDALNNTDGLAGSNPSFTADPAAAVASVRKLALLPVRTVLFGHGEPLESGALDALRKLAGG
jgi:glyoxylase-like metal-dependent hydrolase (beta-lactamase superfamily II)